jgi:uncharacterized coiled-coil DUF342 family protein
MTKPIKLVIDCSTGTASEVECTDEEIAQMQIDAAEAAERRAAEVAAEEALAALKTSARNKLVAGEPLTEEEAATIVL